jgi:hypothetical protein
VEDADTAERSARSEKARPVLGARRNLGEDGVRASGGIGARGGSVGAGDRMDDARVEAKSQRGDLVERTGTLKTTARAQLVRA